MTILYLPVAEAPVPDELVTGAPAPVEAPAAPVAPEVLEELEELPGAGILPGAPDIVPNELLTLALFIKFIDAWIASGVIILLNISGFDRRSRT